ncbi:MAG: EscU/YscU/HrcU family type III secretion system export apparatus switch protein [Burkholderiaceae bacterium]|nr:EscU/YscU/HrcU family type III secretion system export apparatus switch protein [Burkholderiaceae bacterium]
MNAPPRRAVALAYDERERRTAGAPRVVAKGAGAVAEQIVERARAAGVPVHVSRELTALLAQVEIDQRIPPALYVAVAEVLAWAYRLRAQAASTKEKGKPWA